MITYEEALAIARSKKSRINKCTEYTHAYVFSYDDGVYRLGGENPIAVMKDDGRALNFLKFAFMPDNEEIRTFDVEV